MSPKTETDQQGISRRHWAGGAAVLLAIVAALSLWFRLAGFERPALPMRDGLFPSDILYLATMDAERDAALYVENQHDNPLVRIGAFFARRYGVSQRTMLAGQAPLLVLLLLAVAALAWRAGGPLAGALAAWLAICAPATLGVALEFNDLLALQASVAAALACLAWIRRPGEWWLTVPAAFLAAIPSVVKLTASTGLLGFLIYGLASAAIIAPTIRGFRRDGMGPGARRVLWGGLIGLGFLALLLQPWQATLQTAYFHSEMIRPETQGAFSPAAILLAYPSAWALLQVGPVTALSSLAAIMVAAVQRRLRRLVPSLIWLFGPMLALGLVTKRNEYYLLAAVPGTYVLAAVGLTAWRRALWRRSAAVVALLLAAGSWLFFLARPQILPDFWLSTRPTGIAAPRPYDYFNAFHNGDLSPYAPSPRRQRSLDEVVAGAVSIHCRHRPLITTLPWGMDQALDFRLWDVRRRGIPASIYQPFAIPPHGACLLVGGAGVLPPGDTLSALLPLLREKWTRDRGFPPINEAAGRWLAEQAPRFRLVEHWRTGALFVPDERPD